MSLRNNGKQKEGITIETKRLNGNCAEDIVIAAELLKNGGLVAIPTETVYGLAADATNGAAVERIFKAKGRPQDNPLIVHISSYEQLAQLVSHIPEHAKRLMETFWPGPLTMILPKTDKIPLVTSGGLDTVGIRFPSNAVANKIISLCGFPLAAPSANLSGSPSPTNAERVMQDMNTRISAVVDGGEADVGVESTVISFDGDGIRILRPGEISYEMLKTVSDKVSIDEGVTSKLPENAKVRSPGMKYKHYAPAANVILIDADTEDFKKYVQSHKCDGCYCLIFDESDAVDGVPYLTYGITSEKQAHYLFERLRQFDELGAKTVYARCPSQTGVGLAVYNRILRSAGFNLITLRKNS